jgi:hypothetical protein
MTNCSNGLLQKDLGLGYKLFCIVGPKWSFPIPNVFAFHACLRCIYACQPHPSLKCCYIAIVFTVAHLTRTKCYLLSYGRMAQELSGPQNKISNRFTDHGHKRVVKVNTFKQHIRCVDALCNLH